MRKRIKLDMKGLVAIHDSEDENSLYFIGEEANKKMMELRKEYNDDKKLYPKDEFITVHPIKEIENPKVKGVTHEIETNKTVKIPVFRVNYSWGKFD